MDTATAILTAEPCTEAPDCVILANLAWLSAHGYRISATHGYRISASREFIVDPSGKRGFHGWAAGRSWVDTRDDVRRLVMTRC
jgi:hypothetical protein